MDTLDTPTLLDAGTGGGLPGTRAWLSARSVV